MAWAGQIPQLQLQQQQHHLQQQQQQLQQQQLQLQQQQQQQQLQQQQHQHQHQQQLQRQQQQLLQQQQQQQQQQLQQQQQQQQEPLAAYFHLLPLINAFADSVDRGIRDQHVEDLTNDLINRFDKCQEILNSISCSTNPKAMTLHSQRQKREEFENQLNQRRELMNKYRIMVEKAVGSTV